MIMFCLIKFTFTKEYHQQGDIRSQISRILVQFYMIAYCKLFFVTLNMLFVILAFQQESLRVKEGNFRKLSLLIPLDKSKLYKENWKKQNNNSPEYNAAPIAQTSSWNKHLKIILKISKLCSTLVILKILLLEFKLPKLPVFKILPELRPLISLTLFSFFHVLN